MFKFLAVKNSDNSYKLYKYEEDDANKVEDFVECGSFDSEAELFKELKNKHKAKVGEIMSSGF